MLLLTWLVLRLRRSFSLRPAVHADACAFLRRLPRYWRLRISVLETLNARLTEKLHANDFCFFTTSGYRASARQSPSTAPNETVARAVEPFLSAGHLLACRLVGSLHKRLGAEGAASSQACSARLSASSPPAHWPGGR